MTEANPCLDHVVHPLAPAAIILWLSAWPFFAVGGTWRALAKLHGIDVAEIERQVKAELKAKAAAEKEAKKTATPAGKKGSKKVKQEAEA